MNRCGLLSFDLGACVGSWFTGWVPDWVWALLPYWPWLAIIAGAGIAYAIARWPGVVAFATAVGFIFGRRSVTSEHPTPTPVKPVQHPAVPVKRRKTLADLFKRKSDE